MRHRRKGFNSKIKLEHHLIKGLRQLLEELESWPEITSIIPGAIRPVKKHSPLTLKLQYPTQTGLKCIAHSGGAVQEVFLVGSDKDCLEQRFRARFEQSPQSGQAWNA